MIGREKIWNEWLEKQKQVEAYVERYFRHGRSIIQNEMDLSRDEIQKYLTELIAIQGELKKEIDISGLLERTIKVAINKDEML
jgi:hypothetical protein